MVKFVWLVETPLIKAVWRCAIMECGDLYVIQAGITMMLLLSVSNLDFKEQV